MEADRYSIEICEEGLSLSIGLAIVQSNIFYLMRRSILAARGVLLPASHPTPEARFEAGLEALSRVVSDTGHIDSMRELFQSMREVVLQMGGSAVPFGEGRMGEIHLSPPVLPESYRRFYRRSCNLERFQYSGIVIEDGSSAPMTFFPDVMSLHPLGDCTKVYIP